MGLALAELIKSKEGKLAFALLGGAVLVLTAANYYHNIKLNRLRVKELESKGIK